VHEAMVDLVRSTATKKSIHADIEDEKKIVRLNCS
jgi:hypothetical protein